MGNLLDRPSSTCWTVEELFFQSAGINYSKDEELFSPVNLFDNFLDWQISNRSADFAIMPASPRYVGRRPNSDSLLPLPDKIQIWPSLANIENDRKFISVAATVDEILFFSTKESADSVRKFLEARRYKVESSKSFAVSQNGESTDSEWNNRDVIQVLMLAARLNAKVLLHTAHDADPIYLFHR